MAAAAILFKENSLPASGTSFCLFTLVGAALASGRGNLKTPCSVASQGSLSALRLLWCCT